MYSGYALTEPAKKILLKKFPPKYSKVIAHHITVQFGISHKNIKADGVDAYIPKEADLRVVGYVDSRDGLEALVATVDGKLERPDGKMYHITWSLNPESYQPKDSNALVANGQWQKLKSPIAITGRRALFK